MYKPHSLQGLNKKEQYEKTKTKLLNERKTLRSKAQQEIAAMTKN